MLGFAALFLAAASAQAAPSLTSGVPWWERVTYTMSGEGSQQACQYESSLGGTRRCDSEEASSPIKASSSGSGTYTKITIERRFTPGGQPDPVRLESGDTLLGGQIMALAIDDAGSVKSCKIVGASGQVRPAYGCDEARAERFQASAGRSSEQVHQGFITIVVYGHEGYMA